MTINNDSIESTWTTKVEKALVGRKIIKVEYLPVTETEDLGWYSRPIAILLDDGQWLVPMSDDEGNNGGAISVSNNEMLDVIPVI